MMQRFWPGRPALIAGESFTSWFIRVAAANGHRPRDLYRACLPAGDRAAPDLDRHADAMLIQTLADGTGVEPSALRAATFDRWAGWAFERDEDGRNLLPWLPPAGRHTGKRCFGQQVCPHCLAYDPVPHLRLDWRLGIMTTCPTHGSLLLDRCPDCQEPLGFLRQAGRSGFFCARCGSDARRWTGEAALLDMAPLQSTWLGVIERGWADFGTYGPIYSFTALEVLALLARLLAGGNHAYALRTRVAGEMGLSIPPFALPRVRDLAHLPPRSRAVILAMADWLTGEWPHRFVTVAMSAGLASSHIRKRHGEQQPFAFAHTVDWHLDGSQRSGARDEVLAAKQILAAKGQPGTCRNLIALAGTRLTAMSEVADPARDGAPWGQGRYWKLDGVSPEVKAAARAAAHRAGEGVGPWLDALLRKRLRLPQKREAAH